MKCLVKLNAFIYPQTNNAAEAAAQIAYSILMFTTDLRQIVSASREKDCLKHWYPLIPQASGTKLASVPILVLLNIDTCLPGIRQMLPNLFHSHSSQADSRLYSLICGFSPGRVNLHHLSLNPQHFPVLVGTESRLTHRKSLPLHWSPSSQSGQGVFLGYIPGGSSSLITSIDLGETHSIYKSGSN